jgi:hypothetical protein
MKTKNFLGYAGLILAVVSVLVFSGCPNDNDNNGNGAEFDGQLIGTWSNKAEGEYLKEFTINSDSDHSFTAKLNPMYIMSQGKMPGERWTVNGNLKIDRDKVYIMYNLVEADGKAGGSLAGYDGKYVSLTFTDSNTFTFASYDGDQQVTTVFGGDYYRK